MDVLGAIILAVGAGAMKPCINTFGGDQFKKGQVVASNSKSSFDVHV